VMDALRALRAAFGASRMTSGLCVARSDNLLVPHVQIVYISHPDPGLKHHACSDTRLQGTSSIRAWT